MDGTNQPSLNARFWRVAIVEYSIWFAGSAGFWVAYSAGGIAVGGPVFAVVMVTAFGFGFRAWWLGGQIVRQEVQRSAPLIRITKRMAWQWLVAFMPAIYFVLAGVSGFPGYLGIGLVVAVPPILWRMFWLLRLRRQPSGLFPIG